ncbi:hypothetical protein [Roseateles sp.]|uniref:hypothetical protein n=1 Tax=Roseateles sp. TaxID=1971397 RepID=UPI0039E84FF9
MNMPLHKIALFPLVTALVLAAVSARAFTDSNADLKDAAADHSARVVITGKAERPMQTAWVPATPKSLDGFTPVVAGERLAAARNRATLLAKADAAASASRR